MDLDFASLDTWQSETPLDLPTEPEDRRRALADHNRERRAKAAQAAQNGLSCSGRGPGLRSSWTSTLTGFWPARKVLTGSKFGQSSGLRGTGRSGMTLTGTVWGIGALR